MTTSESLCLLSPETLAAQQALADFLDGLADDNIPGILTTKHENGIFATMYHRNSVNFVRGFSNFASIEPLLLKFYATVKHMPRPQGWFIGTSKGIIAITYV